MVDALKDRLKAINKQIDEDFTLLKHVKLEKVSEDKQREALCKFIDHLRNELKKSSDEGKYIKTITDDFDVNSLMAIRFAMEKSLDRYDRVISLMKNYEENFDDDELMKYTMKRDVLDKILSFMVANNIGEYYSDERFINSK